VQNVAAIFERINPVGQNAPVLAIARAPGGEPERCTIVHRSKEGACVRAAAALPDWFVLRAIDSRIERMCKVLWRDGELAGVQYVNARTMGRSRKRAISEAPGKAAFSNVVALYPAGAAELRCAEAGS
jgi:hypothetical protein